MSVVDTGWAVEYAEAAVAASAMRSEEGALWGVGAVGRQFSPVLWGSALREFDGLVDDATGTTLAAFSGEETTEAAMRLLWSWIER